MYYYNHFSSFYTRCRFKDVVKSRPKEKSRLMEGISAYKIVFRIKKSQFEENSRFEKQNWVDWAPWFNRDFTVLLLNEFSGWIKGGKEASFFSFWCWVVSIRFFLQLLIVANLQPKRFSPPTATHLNRCYRHWIEYTDNIRSRKEISFPRPQQPLIPTYIEYRNNTHSTRILIIPRNVTCFNWNKNPFFIGCQIPFPADFFPLPPFQWIPAQKSKVMLNRMNRRSNASGLNYICQVREKKDGQAEKRKK